MYNITSIGNKKVLKQKWENNPEYQKPVSGHVFIGLYTIILLLTYLFNIYAGGSIFVNGTGYCILYVYQEDKAFQDGKSDNNSDVNSVFPLGIVCLVWELLRR